MLIPHRRSLEVSAAPTLEQRAQRSLWHLLGGKAASAVLGVLVVMLMLRMLPLQAYGTFVTLTALLEVLYLISGMGLSTMVQRYLPLDPSGTRMIRLLAIRLLSALMLSGMALAAWQAWSGSGFIDLIEFGVSPPLLLAWAGVACAARLAEEILGSLMMQGIAQTMSSLSNALRILAFLNWPVSDAQPLAWLLGLELALSGLYTTVALGLTWSETKARSRDEAAAVNRHASEMPKGIWRVSLGFWVVQVLGLSFSGSALRLIAAHLGGATMAAVLGAAQSIIDNLRNIQPLMLMSAWLRPVLIGLHERHGQTERIWPMITAVLKLSAVVWLAAIGFVLLYADDLLVLLGGHHPQGLAQALHEAGIHPWALLSSLALGMGLQMGHLAVGLVNLTLEQAGASLMATIAACASVPLTLLLWPAWGLWSLPALVVVAEAVWIGTALWRLKTLGCLWPRGSLAGWGGLLLAGIACLALTAVVSALVESLPVAFFAEEQTGALSLMRIAIGVMASVIGMIWAATALKPLNPSESQALAPWLPRWIWRWAAQPQAVRR